MRARHACSCAFVVMQHHKIIHVADVVPDAEIVLCVAIQPVEIEIGKQLTCQVAERDPDTRPPASEPIMASSSLSVRSQWM